MQWVVVTHPDLSLTVDAAGPYRSKAKARRVADKLDSARDHPSFLSEVVLLETEADLVKRYKDAARRDTEGTF